MSPDELLLALMDLVALAFPEPVYEMTVTFVKNESGARPALKNLDAKARPGQPRRPDLGFADDEVLDEINALLQELADATEKRAGFRVLDGRIHIKEGVATLYEGEQVRLTRTFEPHELAQLLWTAALFSLLNQSEPREEEQSVAIASRLRDVKRYDIDMERRLIVFSPGDLTLRFEPLGSWEAEVWTRAYVHARGPRALTDARISCPLACAERLARHTAAGLGALGVFRARHIFIALFEM